MDRARDFKYEAQFFRPSAHVMAAAPAETQKSSSKTLKGILAGERTFIFINNNSSIFIDPPRHAFPAGVVYILMNVYDPL